VPVVFYHTVLNQYFSRAFVGVRIAKNTIQAGEFSATATFSFAYE